MRNSSLLGLSLGWLLASLAMAFDVGIDDPLFFPSLALGLPTILGLMAGVQTHRKTAPHQPISVRHFIGFALVGVVIVVLSALALITGLYWGEPLPG